MSDKLRVAVMGAGSRSRQAAIPSLAGIGGVEIAGLCDINMDLCNGTADQYGVAGRYGRDVIDYRRMVEDL